MKNIGVIGAGVIGKGVAQTFSQKGFYVNLIDVSDEILSQAKETIQNNVRLQNLFCKNKMENNYEDVLSRINFTTDYNSIKNSDFVVENVTEKWNIKKAVYEKIDKICPSNCIFMVNTSCISITKIAALTKRQSKIIGAHFMNPVPMKDTVETIRGLNTSDETIKKVEELFSDINKKCILVNDYPGFVSNRISHVFMNEAAFVVQDGVATPEKVDKIFKNCFGHKMGPLETADLIGLDTVMNSLDILFESYQDPKFRCCPLIRKMVYGGACGRKTGKGFYKY
ncbi:3-hydroxybutyryl-CoA dehydrogenase [Clostridium sp. CT7]|nr:3-hydroxybutyryl-CoA dehydrogenase [Clostridium sp. CT7]